MKEHWENIGKGDIEAYSKVYTFYYKRLYNYGKKFTDDSSMLEDAIQEIFIMLWTNRTKLSGIHSPYSYLFTSFRNQLFKKIKASKTLAFDSPFVQEDVIFNIEDIMINEESDRAVKKQLEQAVQALTSRQKEAIFLRFYEGLSYNEMATVMHISVKATYKIMARALIQLKENMENFIYMILASFCYYLS